MLTCGDAHAKPLLLAAVLQKALGSSRHGGGGGRKKKGRSASEAADDEAGEEGEEGEEGEIGVAAGQGADAESGEEEEVVKEHEEGGVGEDGSEDEGGSEEEGENGGKDARGGKGGAKRASASTAAPASVGGKVLIFASSLQATHRLTRLVQLLLRLDVREFSSALSPKERAASLLAYKSGGVRVLVASDAMARGMDVEGVDTVVNYDPPANMKGYVHRVGRTARAGRAGTSYTLLHTKEVLPTGLIRPPRRSSGLPTPVPVANATAISPACPCSAPWPLSAVSMAHLPVACHLPIARFCERR